MPIAKARNAILSLADWQRFAPPKSPHHWLDDRSAKEIARAWLEGNGIALPHEVYTALAAHPKFGPVLTWDAEPEAKLRFDKFPGEPRNSDLVVLAVDAAGRYVLAVEGKADEPYGETVAAARAAALERRVENPRSNGIARIEGLVSMLLRPRPDGAAKADELRYQLLTACAGAISEAIRRNTSRAVMLVHEFVTSTTTDKNHKRNAADLDNFLSRVVGGPFGPATDGQIYGPCVPRGTEGVQLFVGKVTRNIRAGNALVTA
jgi:hypothetical protein